MSLEVNPDVKYEFHDGYIVAMAGGSPEHALIAGNFIGTVNGELRKKEQDCSVFSSDLKIRIESTNRTFYPDASVVCGGFVRSEKDPHAITNPTLILEVLSESTLAFDRGSKFAHYRQLPSLQEYVLISQDQVEVDTYYRAQSGLWEIQTLTKLDEVLYLKSLGCQIPLQGIYRMVPDIH